jgi:hypothetical protein
MRALGRVCSQYNPKTAPWERGPGASVWRTGYQLVPNLGGTAHSFTGSTLDAGIVDLLDRSRTPRFDDVPRSYVAISRVRDASNLLLAQPLPPCLFRMGPQPGPFILLQRLKGELPDGGVEKAWVELDSDAVKRKCIRRLADLRLPCGSCKRDHPVDGFTVAPPAGTSGRWYPALTLVQMGAWRRCKACSVQAPTSPVSRIGAPTKLGPNDDMQCYKCNAMRPRKKFDRTAVDALQVSGMAWRAVCLICDPSTLRTELDTGDDVMYLCVRCSQTKPADAFDLTWFKKHGKAWNCKACQAQMLKPACLGCHERPAKPLVHPVAADEDYICTTCRYPRCQNCKEKERPHAGK